MFNNTIHILLVEDNPGDAFCLRLLLVESFGTQFELAVVERLSDAYGCLDTTHFDVCLLDLMLSGHQGMENLQALQQKVPGLPIVLLTDLDGETLVNQSLNSGEQDYLIKEQLNPTWLKQAITHAIERVQLRDKIHTSERQMQQLNLLLRDRLKRRTTMINKMHQQVQKLKTISSIDALTQITNRSGGDKQLKQEWIRSVSSNTPLSLMMIDIDYFKQFNDTYGHPEGDRCLKQVAQVIEKSLNRPRDLVARYGGEEFMVVLSDTGEMGAYQVAESILANVRALGIAHATSKVCDRVTVSLGIATTTSESSELPKDLIHRADQALYHAKHQGRDRLAHYQSIRQSQPSSHLEEVTGIVNS